MRGLNYETTFRNMENFINVLKEKNLFQKTYYRWYEKIYSKIIRRIKKIIKLKKRRISIYANFVKHELNY